MSQPRRSVSIGGFEKVHLRKWDEFSWPRRSLPFLPASLISTSISQILLGLEAELGTRAFVFLGLFVCWFFCGFLVESGFGFMVLVRARFRGFHLRRKQNRGAGSSEKEFEYCLEFMESSY
ncbi:hypothetical protein Droror1_Dr00012392 [Drosera rotundifolia]